MFNYLTGLELQLELELELELGLKREQKWEQEKKDTEINIFFESFLVSLVESLRSCGREVLECNLP